MSIKGLNPLMNVAVDLMLDKDPAEWLAYQMTLEQDPLPETVGEAMEMVKKKARQAIESATKQQAALCDQLAEALDEIASDRNKPAIHEDSWEEQAKEWQKHYDNVTRIATDALSRLQTVQPWQVSTRRKKHG